MVTTGMVFGLYKIYDELGSGGFGTVYDARNTQTREPVAVKVLNPELSDRPDFKQRFLHEAQLLRLLPKHPHIVELRDFGEVQGQPYLVMKYLAGRDLRELVEEGPLTVKNALSIAVQVADALDAALKGGLVHCDIKPENIKIEPGGNVVVMDFGIARAVDSSLRLNAGTPAYMAPELWRYEQPSEATDIYALGCVLYEMLTGQTPFSSPARDDRAQARKDMEQFHQFKIPDWHLFQATNIPGLREQVEAMLAKSALERPSASQVIKNLQAIGEQVPGGIKFAKWVEKSPDIAEDEDKTRPHLIEKDDDTVQHPLPPEKISSDEVTTPPGPVFTPLPTDVQVSIQKHLASLDLGEDACRAALIFENSLYTGTLGGNICQIDLSSGRIQRWNIVPRNKVRSLAAWAFAAYPDRLLFHTGDKEWIEISTKDGQVIRRGKLPETEMMFIHSSGWLYQFGSRNLFYRSPLQTLENPETYDVLSRITGPAYVTHGAIFVPTAAGLAWVEPGSRSVTQIGPRQTARAISALDSKRLVVSYATVAETGLQHTILRLYDRATSPPSLCGEVDITGKGVGAVQVSGSRLILACNDGRVRAWDVDSSQGTWSIQPAWAVTVGAGRGLQCDAALNGGVLALASTKDNSGVLVLLNVKTGEMVSDYPLTGDVFLAPLWHQKTLSIITADGSVEVFRVTFQAGEA